MKTTAIDPAKGSFDDRVISGRRGILAIVSRLKAEEGIDGVILGGTELPLLLRDIEDQGVPFLDTTKLHVGQVVARLLQD